MWKVSNLNFTLLVKFTSGKKLQKFKKKKNQIPNHKTEYISLVVTLGTNTISVTAAFSGQVVLVNKSFSLKEKNKTNPQLLN